MKLGASLWFAMWKKEMISSVAKSIAEQVGSHAFLPKNGLEIKPTTMIVETARDSVAKQSTHEHEHSAATGIKPPGVVTEHIAAPASVTTDKMSQKLTPLEAAWDILQRAVDKHHAQALAQYLLDVGIDKMEDLEFCDEDICIQLCKYLKIVQQKAFLVYMARFRQGVSN